MEEEWGQNSKQDDTYKRHKNDVDLIPHISMEVNL